MSERLQTVFACDCISAAVFVSLPRSIVFEQNEKQMDVDTDRCSGVLSRWMKGKGPSGALLSGCVFLRGDMIRRGFHSPVIKER